MAETSLVKKLVIKQGYRLLILNAPEGYLDLLGELPDGAAIDATADGQYELVLLFVKSKADLNAHAPSAIAAVKPGGLLWFAYPKKSGSIKTDINRDDGWEMVLKAGWDPVTQIAIDATWSALRFKPTGDIKVMTRKSRMGG
ncbi:MAG: hypothetical protein F9K46_14515 [Anaerolineae bacterium]|nr:MAG: hypothetical protein F9K46_14515 [Anaerolineae bacterium]MBZ0284388.1 hypothetical protein [Anaerolineae bacterium]